MLTCMSRESGTKFFHVKKFYDLIEFSIRLLQVLRASFKGLDAAKNSFRFFLFYCCFIN